MKSASQKSDGMTLVEIMMAMTVLALMATGIISALFTMRADAENNLYESSALNCAISFLEQAKSETYAVLKSPPMNANGKEYMTFIVGHKDLIDIPLGESTTVDVPIISTEDGSVKKELPVTVNITLNEATSLKAVWIEIDYSWAHPNTKRIFDGEIRGLRSLVSTY